MATPFQVICLSDAPPDLVTSPFGPYVLHACANLGKVADACST